MKSVYNDSPMALFFIMYFLLLDSHLSAYSGPPGKMVVNIEMDRERKDRGREGYR